MRQSWMKRNCLGFFSALHSGRFCTFFVNELRNILRTSLGFSSDSKRVSIWICTYNLLHRKTPLYPLGPCCTWIFPPPPIQLQIHTGYQLPAISCNQRTLSALYCRSIRAFENVSPTQFVQPFQPTTNRLWLVHRLFPQYTAGVLEHSKLMNQNSLPSNTEKWCLCHNPNTIVSINKQCFPQIFV